MSYEGDKLEDETVHEPELFELQEAFRPKRPLFFQPVFKAQRVLSAYVGNIDLDHIAKSSSRNPTLCHMDT